MPKQLRDARITQRSEVLSQHHGLVFRGTVTTYTDTTHFKVSGFPAYGSASDFPENFFDGYYVYCAWDAGAGGAAPQGEKVLASGYTSADGTITHAVFTTPLEADDEILMVHPSVMNSDVIDELDELLELTLTSSNIAVTAAETDMYKEDVPVKIIAGVAIQIDTSNMAAGDTYTFREYYRIEAGGSYVESAGTATLTGAQAEPLHTIHLEAYRYGIHLTAQKIAGTDRSFRVLVIREA